MKLQELKTKPEAELRKMVTALQDDLRRLRFSRASAQLKDMRAMRSKRRSIARVLTLLQKLETRK